MSCPSTQLFTVTVLSAVTVPSPLRKMAMSPVLAGTATTGMTRTAGLLSACLDERDCAAPFLASRMYAPTAITQIASTPTTHFQRERRDRSNRRPCPAIGEFELMSDQS